MKAVVSVSFDVEYDTDRARDDWNEPGLTDEEVLAEFLDSIYDDWDFWSARPDAISVQGELVGG